ncbi:GNAT family N-acetyltransferase [Candidatus Pacearchaeota archaeon]|nr:GNAT family N-acetyltransferase [Candidatus Pacearchaeota archaeon]
MVKYRTPRNEKELAEFYRICEEEAIILPGGIRYSKRNGKTEVANFNDFGKRTVIALDKNKVVGGVQYGKAENTLLPEDSTQLELIAVEKSHKRKGIGKTLIQRLLEYRKEVWVLPLISAISFYNALNFKRDQAGFYVKREKRKKI